MDEVGLYPRLSCDVLRISDCFHRRSRIVTDRIAEVTVPTRIHSRLLSLPLLLALYRKRTNFSPFSRCGLDISQKSVIWLLDALWRFSQDDGRSILPLLF